MKLLHLFSNWKLTGPAEPAVRLAAALQARGHEVVFAHMPLPAPAEGAIDEACRSYGVQVEGGFALPKHFDVLASWRDARRLARLFDERRFDVVHCHMTGDHLPAAIAAGRAASRPRLVRTNHEAAPLRPTLRNRFLLPRRVDALIELSREALEADVATFGLPRERVHLVDAAVQLERFAPERELPDLRARWGLAPEHLAVGVVARIQRHRRYEVVIEAARRAREELPELRLVLVGRGTHMAEVAEEPVRRHGLADVTVFPGYLRGDEYVAGLRALDVLVFLMPGTDGSCRAAREALATGTPVIAARRGMLPELITDGEDGFVIDDTPAELAACLVRLGKDRELVRRLGEGARRTALRRFDPAAQAEQVERIYEGL